MSSADRHSRRVAFLKVALPALGVALLLLVLAWPELRPLLERVRLSPPVVDLRDAREIRMTNPRYAGVDRENRPFVITAAVGRQIPNREDLMSLEQPRGDMTLHSGGWVILASETGVYQPQAQLLDLFGDVNLYRDTGMRFVTATARVNLADNSAEGHDPVDGHGPTGDVTGQGFRVLEGGRTIVFTGTSHLHINGAPPRDGTREPPSLPAPVAAAADGIAADVPGAAPARAGAARPASAAQRGASSNAGAAPHGG